MRKLTPSRFKISAMAAAAFMVRSLLSDRSPRMAGSSPAAPCVSHSAPDDVSLGQRRLVTRPCTDPCVPGLLRPADCAAALGRPELTLLREETGDERVAAAQLRWLSREPLVHEGIAQRF